MSNQTRSALSLAILGAGGVGGLLAALLSRGGDRVAVLSSGASAARLREGGVRVRSRRFGDFEAAVSVAERLETAVDVCVVAVKALDLESALERMSPDVVGQGLVVPLLNGVEHVALLRERYPDARVVAATIRVESARVAPGEIEQTSPFAAVEMAALPGADAEVERLREQLEAVDLDVVVRDDEATVLWSKLVFLAPLALLTTTSEASIGPAREARHAELVALVEEAAAVAQAEGAAVSAGALVTALEGLPPTMMSSMQRDAAAGRPLEIDAIGGAVLRAAARHGLSVPVTARLVGQLRGSS